MISQFSQQFKNCMLVKDKICVKEYGHSNKSIKNIIRTDRKERVMELIVLLVLFAPIVYLAVKKKE